MRGMRNIIAHQYGTIDDELVYSVISQELYNDVNMFVKLIDKLFKE